jgi:hypothetical protein
VKIAIHDGGVRPEPGAPALPAPTPDVTFESSNLLLLIPQYEEASNVDFRGSDQRDGKFDPRMFEQFKAECEQDILARIERMDIKHVEYSGHLSKGTKDGKGHHYDKATGSFYYGAWTGGKQHGYGIKFFGKNSKIAQTGIRMLRRPDDEEKQTKQS